MLIVGWIVGEKNYTRMIAWLGSRQNLCEKFAYPRTSMNAFWIEKGWIGKKYVCHDENSDDDDDNVVVQQRHAVFLFFTFRKKN